MSNHQAFSLDRLESLAYGRRHEEATEELFKLLKHLDQHGGYLDRLGAAPPRDVNAEQRDIHFVSRIASAVSTLFSDPAFRLSDAGFLRLIPLQRFLGSV